MSITVKTIKWTTIHEDGGPIEVVAASAYDALKRQLEEYEHETETVKELKAENERLRAALESILLISEGANEPTSAFVCTQIAREALGLEEK
jgi:hypothetical protein